MDGYSSEGPCIKKRKEKIKILKTKNAFQSPVNNIHRNNSAQTSRSKTKESTRPPQPNLHQTLLPLHSTTSLAPTTISSTQFTAHFSLKSQSSVQSTSLQIPAPTTTNTLEKSTATSLRQGVHATEQRLPAPILSPSPFRQTLPPFQFPKKKNQKSKTKFPPSTNHSSKKQSHSDKQKEKNPSRC
jgi:hypothetical protein